MRGDAGVGYVLDQRAAQGDVEDLDAPADAQDGLPGLKEGAEQGQLRPVPHGVGGLGPAIFLKEQGGVQIAAAAQNQAGTGQIRLGGVGRPGHAALGADRGTVVVRCSLLTGELDIQGRSFHQTFAASWALRARTRAAISSAAPSMPVTLELRVRSYRRILPQVWPV